MKLEIYKDQSLPLHIQLLDDLRHKIKTGAFQPHEQLPGEWELVKALNISRATIQRAWQEAETEGLIYRIAGKGTFVSDQQPKAVPGVISLVVPEFRGTFAVQILTGAERVLRQEGYQVRVAGTEYSIEGENAVLRRMRDDGASGCMVWANKGSATDRSLATLTDRMPVVLIDRPVPELALPCVTSNNYEGGAQATRHLIELGHRRIAFLARPHLTLWTVAERYRAYQDTMREAGLRPLEPILIGDDQELSSYNAYQVNDDQTLEPLVNLLCGSDRPTAIFAVNDWMALRVLRAASAASVRIPDDLSLVGFDNLDVVDFVSPPLTTVAQNTERIGAEAARLLLGLIGGETAEQIMTLIPPRLIVRQSTAPPG